MTLRRGEEILREALRDRPADADIYEAALNAIEQAQAEAFREGEADLLRRLLAAFTPQELEARCLVVRTPDEWEAMFWSRVDRRGDTECWRWQGADNGQGYGVLYSGKKPFAAHRLSVEISGRVIPDGMFIDHICRNTRCVNPAHLRIVTPAVNSTENSFSVSAHAKAKTHCLRGHPFAGDNLKIIMRGGRERRVCRACARDYQREWHRQKAAASRHTS